MRALKSSVLLLAAALTFHCAGSKGKLRLDNLDYPASFSGYIYDEKQQPLRIGNGVKKVGDVTAFKRVWSILYGQAALSDDAQLVTEFNEGVKKTGATGVVNLQLESSACLLNHFFILNILPFWPGCTVLELRGDAVVKGN
jgi:hypothetical protein